MELEPKTKTTHLVIKLDDAQKYLSNNELQELGSMLEKIELGRQKDKKRGVNEYLIVNTDEPYANEVYKIILKGEKEDER